MVKSIIFLNYSSFASHEQESQTTYHLKVFTICLFLHIVLLKYVSFNTNDVEELEWSSIYLQHQTGYQIIIANRIFQGNSVNRKNRVSIQRLNTSLQLQQRMCMPPYSNKAHCRSFRIRFVAQLTSSTSSHLPPTVSR